MIVKTIKILSAVLLGFALCFLIKFPDQGQFLLLVGAAILIVLLVSALIKPPKQPKKAIDVLKEGEIHNLLRSCGAREAGNGGVIAMVRSNKTKELKWLIYEEDPPLQHMKHDGKIVSYP